MKFLVTGATGLVGIQVVKDLLNSNHVVYSCYHDSPTEKGISKKIDLVEPTSLSELMNKINPEVVIHLAAMTNVDLCESQKELAMKVNAKSTQTVAQQATKLGSFFVYVSTDYVFDGIKGNYNETDIPNPLNFYGKTKLEGENFVRELDSDWCIARTSTPFGLHPARRSFPLLVAQNLKSQKQFNAVTDQFTSPTYVPNLSKMLIEIATKKIRGIFHLAGATRISRYDLSLLVANNLNLNTQFLKRVTIKDLTWKAQRPADSSLDVSKATEILQEKPFSIQQSIESFVKEIII